MTGVTDNNELNKRDGFRSAALSSSVREGHFEAISKEEEKRQALRVVGREDCSR
jgi:hypothetical protein